MQIQINSPHETVSPTFSEHIENNIQSVLGPYENRLTRVEIHFKDLNGHKGGVDKRCAIEVRPSGMGPLAADDEGENVRDAFKGALDKIERVLKHKLGKEQTRQHGG